MSGPSRDPETGMNESKVDNRGYHDPTTSLTAFPVGSIAEVVHVAETIGMPVMGDEPFNVIGASSIQDNAAYGKALNARSAYPESIAGESKSAAERGIYTGGQYPPADDVKAYTFPTLFDRLPDLTADINRKLAEAGFPESESLTRQMLAMGEEIGEFLGAVRRFHGMARRRGTWDDVLNEWADVVITAFVTANTLGLTRSQMETALQSKLDVIFSRGWHDNQGDLFTDS